jgi:hypothetical protein
LIHREATSPASLRQGITVAWFTWRVAQILALVCQPYANAFA